MDPYEGSLTAYDVEKNDCDLGGNQPERIEGDTSPL
jgi:hypothetical protein